MLVIEESGKRTFTNKEIQEGLDITDNTLISWRKQGLSAFKIGAKVFFQEQDLYDFLIRYKSERYVRR